MAQTIDQILGDLQKKHGKEAIMALDSKPLEVETISTGSLAFDLASGIGGFPRGRIVEIYGPEATSKTTLSIHHAVEVQKAGYLIAYIDVEHAFDRQYARSLGLDDSKTLFAQPNSGEDALNLVEDLLKTKSLGLIVVDSVAALTPAAEIAGEMGDSKMGLHARLMSQAMRKLVGAAESTKCTLIFINQLRMKLGVMFGSPETTSGGEALKYYASIRIDMRKNGQATKDKAGIGVGQGIKGTFKKNKLAPPGTVAETLVVFGEGIDKNAELVDLGEQFEILEKKGSWYGYQGGNLAQGKEGMRTFFKENPDFADLIEQAIKDKLLK